MQVVTAAEELQALARELDDSGLALDPAAVACKRLLANICESPRCNSALPFDELRSRVRQIRSGLTAQLQIASTESDCFPENRTPESQ